MADINEIIQNISPYYKIRKKPAIEHKLTYDSPSETLEPVYFWMLDFIKKTFDNVEKLVDNFASSPGSGHFSELRGKATQMQQESSRILATINAILKSVINILYDLKEFKIRLSHYEHANSNNKSEAEAGLLALKQIWMDKVDIQRGQGSINAMSSGNLQFVTLRDAFMSIDSVKAVDKLDLNERVKRILKPRVQEFFEWKKRSEIELKNRFEIEKTYLKSQVDALKLQARWAKPYLKAAEKLTEDEDLQKNAALVTAFNTVLLQLSLMAYSSVSIESSIIKELIPEGFRRLNEKKKIRNYNSVVIIDLNFRGIPAKVGQHYTFGGRVELSFKSYGLNDDEMKLLRYKLGQSDLNDALKLVQGMTDDSLQQLNSDIDDFLLEKTPDKKKEDPNPFSALFSFEKSGKKEMTKEEKEKDELKKLKELENKGIKPDNYAEKYIRNLAEADAMNQGFNVYDIYKKSLGMGSVRVGGDKGETKKLAPVGPITKFMGFEDR